MAFKIPEAPNIIGGQTVLRQPDVISSTTVVPNMGFDPRALQKGLGDFADYAVETIKRRNNVMMSEAQVQWHQNMQVAIDDMKQNYKRRNATDLYATVLKKASAEITADILGANKNDGQIRIQNAELQRQFQDWVNGQQNSLITLASSYENSEWDLYERETWDAANKQNAEGIANAQTHSEMLAWMKNTNITLQRQLDGAHPLVIKQAVAANIEVPVMKYYQKDIVNAPTNVAAAMQRNEQTFVMKDENGKDLYIIDFLSPESQAKLRADVQKSFMDKAANDVALGLYNQSQTGSRNLLEQELKLVFGNLSPEELEAKRDEIYAKANKIETARRAESEGVRAQVLTNNMATFFDAPTAQMELQALQTIQELDPEAANGLQTTKQDMMARNSIFAAYYNTNSGYEAMKDEYEANIKYNTDLKFAQTKEDLVKEAGMDNWVAVAQKGIDAGWTPPRGFSAGDAPKYINDIARAVARQEAIKEEPKTALFLDYETKRAALADKVREYNDKTKADIATFKAVSRDISAGLVTGWDSRMTSLEGSLKQELALQIVAKQRYNEIKKKVPELDKAMRDIDPQYSKLYDGHKAYAESRAIEMVDSYYKRNGTYPDSIALRDIARQAYVDTTTDTMKSLSDSIDKHDTGIGLSSAVASKLGYFGASKQNTFINNRKKAEETVREWGRTLKGYRQEVIEQNIDYLTDKLQFGATSDMIRFVDSWAKYNE